jgi:putative selenate reductase
VYRRSFAEMPASREEHEDAVADGVAFRWLVSPESLSEDGTFVLRNMELGDPDSGDRRRPIPTEHTEAIQVDSVVYAVGDDPESEVLAKIGLHPDETGYVETDPSGETELENVYLIGDSRTGTSTIVQCIAEGRRAADQICEKEFPGWFRRETIPPTDATRQSTEIEAKRGLLQECPEPRSAYDARVFAQTELTRCLECNYICNKCVDVCPNRANISVPANSAFFKDPNEIVHIDAYCNECGNCATFCPWNGKPYLDKPTVFTTYEDFEKSKNPGWLVRGELLTLRYNDIEKSISIMDIENMARRMAGGNVVDESENKFYRLFVTLYASRPEIFTAFEVDRV